MLFPEAEITWITLGSLHLKCYAGKNSPLVTSKTSNHYATEITIHHLQNETQYITENFLSMNVGFAKVSPKMQIVSNNDLLCELIKHNGWAAMPEEYMKNYLKVGDLAEVNIKEMSNSRLISLNIYFMVGKDTHVLFKDIISWIVNIANSSLQ